MSLSSSSSRKRRRDVPWECVVHSIKGLTVDSNVLIQDLTQLTSDATMFSNLPSKIQEVVCLVCGVTGWQDVFLDEIKKQVQG